MSGRGGGGGNNGVSGIPAASRKMVQSLKEIVDNCTEQEIYATLKECNMDPNEAVNRLLSQDPFHEVKSKREKKKENKDITETRSRGLGSNSNRGNRGSSDRYAGRGGSNQFSTTASGVFHGKLPSRKENGNHSYAGLSSSAPLAGENNMNWQPLPYSNVVVTENKISTVGAVDGFSSSQPYTGHQSAWSGAKGQVSMADIVKMGRPQGNASALQNAPVHSVGHSNNVLHGSVASCENLHSSQNKHAHKVSEMHTEPGLSYQQISPDDEWPSVEPPPTISISTVKELTVGSNSEPSNIPKNGMNQKISSGVDVHVAEDGSVETTNGKHVRPASVSGRDWQEDDSRGASGIDTNLYKEMSTYEQHVQTIKHNEAEDGVMSVSENLNQLRLEEDDEGIPTKDDNPSVVIPDHLQIHPPDCFHLSFGSFGSGTRPLTSKTDEIFMPADVSSAVHSETRNPGYYPEEHLRPSSDGNVIQRGGPSDENYDSPSISQAEVLKQETPEIAPSNEYAFSSSTPDYTYESNHQSSIAYAQQQTSSQIQNLGPFASIMANSLPSTLLASTGQTGREDPSYSPFLVTQSMPTKYSNVASSITGPTISMSEALRSSNISDMSQHAPQALPGANVPTGPTLSQHLNVHQYSQPNLPLSHFANMISYPLLPQSYAYMPSTFPQAYAGNSTAYHQSLAAMLPQYKNNVSVSSFPQSAAIPSGYGFGSSTSIPGGNFPLNLPAAAMGTNIGYDDVMSSQFKDNSHLISLQQQQQQNDNSAMWVQQAPGSRTTSPGSNYYSFQGQSQPTNALRQSQQQQSHHHFGGALGYPNYYHSQTGIPLEHQQQNLRDSSLGGSPQGSQPPPKPSQQIWQNGY